MRQWYLCQYSHCICPWGWLKATVNLNKKKSYLPCAMVLHRAALILLFWGTPPALLAAPPLPSSPIGSCCCDPKPLSVCPLAYRARLGPSPALWLWLAETGANDSHCCLSVQWEERKQRELLLLCKRLDRDWAQVSISGGHWGGRTACRRFFFYYNAENALR